MLRVVLRSVALMLVALAGVAGADTPVVLIRDDFSRFPPGLLSEPLDFRPWLYPPSFALFGGSGLGYQSVGFGGTSDAMYAPPGTFGLANGSGLILTKAWGVRGAFNHNWSPTWSSSSNSKKGPRRWGSPSAISRRRR